MANNEALESINDYSSLEINDYSTITTFDNPFNPFTDFDNWNAYDQEQGYYTWQKVARLANIDDSMTELEKDEAIEDAIDRLIEIDFLNVFRKVSPSDYSGE